MTDHPHPPHGELPPPPRRFPLSRGAACGGALILVLAAGVAAGASGSRWVQRMHPQAVMLLQPGPIGALKDDAPVAVKGQIAEVFGSKFIVQDDSGRALVDTGPRGERAKPVAKGDTITVQVRFDRGVIHAQVLVYADGTSEAFGPPRHRGGPPDEHRRHAAMGPSFGPGPDHGPRPPRPGADRGPPPPPPAERGPAPGDATPPPPPEAR